MQGLKNKIGKGGKEKGPAKDEEAPGSPAADADGAAEGAAAPASDQAAAGSGHVVAAAAADLEAQAEQAEEALDEDEDYTTGDPKGGRKGILARLKGGQGEGADDDDDDIEKLQPFARPRYWEMNFAIRSFQNVTVSGVSVFFSARIESVDPSKFTNKVKLIPQFSPIYHVAQKEELTLPMPFSLYVRKHFILSYENLQKHQVKIDAWKIRSWTFNIYYGYHARDLLKVAQNAPDLSFLLKKKLPKGKKKGKTPDVMRFSCSIQLEEMMEYSMHCDHWTLEYEEPRKSGKGDAERFKKRKLIACKEAKRLKFIMPTRFDSAPGAKGLSGSHPMTTDWMSPEEKGKPRQFYWQQCGCAKFIGTASDLRNAYFRIYVYSSTGIGKYTNKNDKFSKIMLRAQSQTGAAGNLVGKSVLSLTSVLDVSVFKGRVKDKRGEDYHQYDVAELRGNVNVDGKSYTWRKKPHKENDLQQARPEQPQGAGTMGNLTNRRYLVVFVTRCDNLRSTKPGGLCDPYLRLSWDNMQKQSIVLASTTKPIFNRAFYFPVLTPYPASKKNEREYDGVNKWLRFEFEGRAKRQLKIEVWDNDDASAELLGKVSDFDMSYVFSSKKEVTRSLLPDAKKDHEDEENKDDFYVEPPKQWYEKQLPTRVYVGNKTPLTGGTAAGVENPRINFEVYFFPDFGPDSSDKNAKTAGPRLYIEGQGAAGAKSKWAELSHKFQLKLDEVQDEFKLYFPDSIGAKKNIGNQDNWSEEFRMEKDGVRRFFCIDTDDQLPLMANLSPIIIPEAFSFAAKLMSWMHSFPFVNSRRHQTDGLIDSWRDPETILQGRQGSVQDHAVLLCSFLLGCTYDAYVVKGTIKNEVKSTGTGRQRQFTEHVWVMTRDTSSGFVTFWEPCNKKCYHLPNRCKPEAEDMPSKQSKKVEETQLATKDEDSDDEGDPAKNMVRWAGEVPDTTLQEEDMMLLPTVGRALPKPKAKTKSRAKSDKDPRDRMREERYKKRNQSAPAPRAELLERENLVTCLPYHSVEFVFNNRTLYANRRNHHPACILYNFHEKMENADKGEEGWRSWQPFPDGEEDVTFTSGRSGLGVDEATGNINKVTKGSQAEQAGVQVGWKIMKIDGEAYDPQKLNAKSKGLSSYEITFQQGKQDTTNEIEPKAQKVGLGEQIRALQCANIKRGIQAEVEENIRLYRTKNGLDTIWKREPQLTSTFELFLKILETWSCIDMDYEELTPILAGKSTDPVDLFIIETLKPMRWNVKPVDQGKETTDEERYAVRSPWEPMQDKKPSYHKAQEAAFKELKEKITEFNFKKTNLPIAPGKTLEGFPVHFSTSEPERIREYLQNEEQFRKFKNYGVKDAKGYSAVAAEDVSFTVVCHVERLQGAILSVWFYIAVQVPRAEE